MKMRQIDGLDIPSHGSARLEANGKHLMMFNLNKDLAEGEHVMLLLEFDDGSKQEVMVMVTKMVGMNHGDDMAKDMETGMQKVTPTKAEIHAD